MAYSKINWENEITPLSAGNFNHMDEGIYEAHELIADATEMIEEASEKVDDAAEAVEQLSDSKAPLDNPEFSTRVTAPLFRVTGHSSAIGAMLTQSNSAQIDVTAGVARRAAAITLPVGTWLVICAVNLPKPSADQYIRMAFDDVYASTRNDATYHYTSKALIKPQLVKIVNVTAEKIYNFSLYSSVDATIAVGNATITAIRFL